MMDIYQLKSIVGKITPQRGAPPATRVFLALSDFFFAARGIDFLHILFSSGPSHLVRRCCSVSFLHSLIWRQKNFRLTSTKGLSGVHFCCHRGHLHFSEQIRCGNRVMCCGQITPEDTSTLLSGTVCSETAVKSNSDASRHRIHR